MSHTPGPWQLKFDKQWPFALRVIAKCGKEVLEQKPAAFSSADESREDVETARNWGHKDKDEVVESIAEQTANARLIASAPDLLAVVEEIHSHLYEKQDYFRVREMARVAIAKAKGGAA